MMLTVGAKYANRKNGHVVILDEVSDKFPTVAIVNLDGSNRRKVNKSSFTKSYKSLEAPAETEKKQDKTETEKATKDAGKPVETSSKQSEKDAQHSAQPEAKAEPKAESKETEKKEKKVAKPKSEKPKKEKVEALPVLDTIAKILEDLNVEFKRNRDGINASIFTVWKRKTKARFYISSEGEEFANLNQDLIDNLHDNPTKNSKKDKSFYVEFKNLKPVIESMIQ